MYRGKNVGLIWGDSCIVGNQVEASGASGSLGIASRKGPSVYRFAGLYLRGGLCRVTAVRWPRPPLATKHRNLPKLPRDNVAPSVGLSLGPPGILECPSLGDHSPELTSEVARFLRQVPAVQARIEEIHEAVVAGRLDLVRRLVEHKKFAYSRDPQGATPLHKAVLHQQLEVISFFLQHYPSALHARDHQGRTPLHYAAVLEDDSEIYDVLLDQGADENATDVYGHTPTYYLESDELTLDQLREGVRRSARYREGTLHKASRVKHRDSLATNRSFSAKRAGNRSQVREMIRQGNLEVLEELVLHGHGDKLLGESSLDPIVQEFLDTVPGYMEQISDVHRAVVRGRLREVQTLISHKSLSLARDAMGLTPLHKAALFGHYDIAEHLAVNFPASMAAKDLDGRTALHLAAGLRDGQRIYDMLIFAGAPTNMSDSVGKRTLRIDMTL
ncbi:hypothetical protein BIW11_01722 [Tropilaelaps mercedesae]|uniref:Uncharacterized protein n=1 Tax=Tropilaelaps mercedesae TaxID=418985 RepID=A0A1V9X9Z3_9ACAR|nr:hypothetical protein BIW11_01722 [Tropilaelaps mercedesae]